MSSRNLFLLVVVMVVPWPSCLAYSNFAKEEGVPLRRTTRQRQPEFGITHLDIRDAVLTLDRSIKRVASKLDRHEARESQVAAQHTKTLTGLQGGMGTTKSGVQAVARQLATMEDRLLALESLVQTADERQRLMISQLTQGLDRLLSRQPDLGDLQPPPLPPLPSMPNVDPQPEEESEVMKAVQKLNNKVTAVETILERDMLVVKTGVEGVGESLKQHIEELQGRHDRLEDNLDKARGESHEAFGKLTQDIKTSTAAIQEQVKAQSHSECAGGQGGAELTSCVESFERHSEHVVESLQDLKEITQEGLADQLNTLHTILLETSLSQDVLNTSLSSLAEFLGKVNVSTQVTLQKMTSGVVETIQKGVDMLEGHVSQNTDMLHQTIMKNFSDLSEELSSLKKVEQVMIHTADSVLDAKRSIEFGKQQVILELGELVRTSGGAINTTLHDQISNMSSILNNQTSALANMTTRMEQEISQVWRQIGIMYQQMTQSVDLLDQLKDTTKEHMNASLSRVGNMDGTVGKINSKVADVESNLNFLLGRLSLVVSEFNLMKNGVAEELMRLRDSLAEENNSPVHFGDGGKPSSDSRYDVNRESSG